MGMLKCSQVSLRPSIASTNCHMISGRSGLPKFKQSVNPIGSAPEHTRFRAASATAHLAPFDAVFVYEALHHAYDWRKACEQAYKSLKPGGWFLLCNEPNILHTLISYRYSQLSRSPEIGFSKREVFRVLKECGFEKRVILAKRFGFFVRGLWIAVQRPVES